MEDWKKVVSAWNNLDIKEIGIESRPQLILMVANSPGIGTIRPGHRSVWNVGAIFP